MKKIFKLLLVIIIIGAIGSCFGEKEKTINDYTNEELLTYLLQNEKVVTPDNYAATLEDAVHSMAANRNINAERIKWEIIENENKEKLIKANVIDPFTINQDSEINVFFPIKNKPIEVLRNGIYSESVSNSNSKKVYLKDLNLFSTGVFRVQMLSKIIYEFKELRGVEVIRAIYSQKGIQLPDNFEELPWEVKEDKDNFKIKHFRLSYKGIEISFSMTSTGDNEERIDVDSFNIQYWDKSEKLERWLYKYFIKQSYKEALEISKELEEEGY